MPPASRLLVLTGSIYLAAVLVLFVTRTPLGSQLFFTVLTVQAIVYALMLARVWSSPLPNRRLFYAAFAFALAFRVPLALAPVGPDNDMIRYLWDGRVQRLGYNPYLVVPADPAMQSVHTSETARMPSLRARTPYPPAAQLFFRTVVTIHESALAMKLALVACDVLTILVLWRWLAVTDRNEWLTLAYAWNPLVVLEVAHSGHIDALGALWIAASAFWLTRRRTLLAGIALVLAVASKLLPIVIAPLYIGRIRLRDAAVAVLVLVLLYLPFTAPGTLPFGAVPNVVAHIRFNGPAFLALAAMITPQGAGAAAVALGIIAAAVARWKLPVTDPAGWAWPMAIALACAPVIYPWYLLYLTPFLFARATLPLLAWTFSTLAAYVVWHLSRHGGRWVVPGWTMAVEFGVPIAALVVLLVRQRRARAAMLL